VLDDHGLDSHGVCSGGGGVVWCSVGIVLRRGCRKGKEGGGRWRNFFVLFFFFFFFFLQHFTATPALGLQESGKRTKVVALLKKFTANPAQIRHDLQVKLGILDELAAEIFALCSCAMNFFNSSHPLSSLPPPTQLLFDSS